MNLEITEHTVRIIIASPKGRFDILSAPTVRAKLDELLAEGAVDFVVDLSETLFLDSAGMAVLVSLLRRARQAGGDAKLVWPGHEAARRVLTLTRFDRVFDIANSVEAALKCS